MKIWSVSNQKGGVGKTTTVTSLGGLLSSWGFRTLLVDLDPQGSLTSYFRLNPDDIKTSVYSLFQDATRKKQKYNPKPYIVKTDFDCLALLPASTAIATLDRQVASLDGMGLVISNSLSEIADEYDHVIIDTPPMLGVLMINALAACDHLIIPVLTEFLALKGLDRMMNTLQMIFRSSHKTPSYTILPTMFDKRTKAAVQSLLTLREQHPADVWKSVIPIDTKLREASRAGIPASLYEPNSRAVKAYADLLELLLLEKDHNDHKIAMA